MARTFLPDQKLLFSSLTPAGKVTNWLSTEFSLEIAEGSEAISAKQSFASKINF